MSARASTTSSSDIPMPVRIREADGEADAWYLQRQWHHWFGAQYESQTAMQHDLFEIAGWTLPDDAEQAPLDSYGVIAEHVSPGGQAVPVGGGVALLLDHATAVDELPDGGFDREALAGDPTVWFLLGVVDSAWRGRGIGSQLFERRLEWAHTTDAEIAIAFGWERSGGSSRPLFERHDWVPVETVEALYTDTSRSACPDCGVWPADDAVCRCDATLWALDLPTGGTQ